MPNYLHEFNSIRFDEIGEFIKIYDGIRYYLVVRMMEIVIGLKIF